MQHLHHLERSANNPSTPSQSLPAQQLADIVMRRLVGPRALCCRAIKHTGHVAIHVVWRSGLAGTKGFLYLRVGFHIPPWLSSIRLCADNAATNGELPVAPPRAGG